MPLRLGIPFAIIYVNWKAGDWIYEQIRLKWYGYHRSMNNVSYAWFGADDIDIPPPRKFDINEKHIKRGNFLLYEVYLNMRRKEDVTKVTTPDPEPPKMIVNNDIVLKESLVSGNREKERYIFDDLMVLPFYYRRWRDRTKPERDQNAKDLAKEGVIVYGAPYWNGIKSSDL
eukprot:363474_1